MALQQLSLQDVIRCHLCETPNPPMHCDICHENLCKSCVGEHLSENFEGHKVVEFKLRGSTPKCPKHSTKICELFCEECNIPICSICISSGEHEQHKKEDIFRFLKNKKDLMQNDLKELESSIFPEYQRAATDIPSHKANLSRSSQKLTKELYKQREIWHQEIDIIFELLQSRIDTKDSNFMSVLEEEEHQINLRADEISQIISEIRGLLDSNDVCLVSSYKSRNTEFRRLPRNFKVSLPKFTARKINRWQLYQKIGSLSDLAFQIEEQGDSMQTPGAVSLPSDNQLIEEPRILTEIPTDYEEEDFKFKLNSVSCNSNEIWTCGGRDEVKIFNHRGEFMKQIDTRSNDTPPTYITVAGNGDVLFTNPANNTINVIKNFMYIRILFKLWGWIPLGVCSSSTGDILVIMNSDDGEQTKVVRYSGSEEKQTIQWDEQGLPLFLTLKFVDFKCITENRNLDICVSDCNGGAVVVLNAAGILRFRYTGHPSRSVTREMFDPCGITTDSQGRILISDSGHGRIHILDQDGQFLRYIENLDFKNIHCICVDSRDNLFVAESYANTVMKIKYCEDKTKPEEENRPILTFIYKKRQ